MRMHFNLVCNIFYLNVCRTIAVLLGIHCAKCILLLFYCLQTIQSFCYRVHGVVFFRKEIQQHEQFKQRCNAFFMEVIHTLSFSSNAPPERNVIVKLMNYIICEQGVTRGPAVFDDCVDRTPVLRSFLLQLLLKYKYVTKGVVHLSELCVECRCA